MPEATIEITVREGVVRWVPPYGILPGRWSFLRREGSKLVPAPMPKRLRAEYSDSQ